MEKDRFEDLYQQAIQYMVSGYDEVYIINQFSDEGIDNDTINKVIDKIKKVRKSEMKVSGIRLLIYGLSFILVGLGLSWWASAWNFDYGFILWGLPIIGVIIAVKGLAQIIGL